MTDIFANMAGAYIEDNVHSEYSKEMLQHIYGASSDELLVLNCASAGLREIVKFHTIDIKTIR